jgi:Ca2+-binding EF-hand superfamily protein
MPIVAGGAPTKQKELPPPSAEELADFQEAFDNFDRDKSGSIDKRELATVMRSLGYTPSEKQIAKILAIADKDNDGWSALLANLVVE